VVIIAASTAIAVVVVRVFVLFALRGFYTHDLRSLIAFKD